MAGRTFPVNSYLRRIDKHPTGDCPWCEPGVTETLCHFQSECKHFQKNRITAHHDIAKATMAALKDTNKKGWVFFYETELRHLPFKFAWASEAEAREQEERRPDGVAWNALEGTVIFLEFTRAMDNPDNMQAACQAKGRQYAVAEEALRRAQRRASTRHPTLIGTIRTAPLIFGVRGTVMVQEAQEGLAPLKLTSSELDRVLARGVRAAITAASDMCAARFAALKTLPKAPRGADGKRVKVIIPPKHVQPPGWRSDRGWGGSRANKRTLTGTR